MLVRDMNSGRLVMVPDVHGAPVVRTPHAAPHLGHVYTQPLAQYRPVPFGYSDERLGLPILAALPAIAAKALPIVASILPMLGRGSKKGPSSAPAAGGAPSAGSSLLSTITGLLPRIVSALAPMPQGQSMPAPAPTAAPLPEPAAITAPLPLPTTQTIAPGAPMDSTGNIAPPVTATTRTTDVDTEVVVAPMRVRRPDGQIAIVPMRVRRRRRRRGVRTMQVAPPAARWPMPMVRPIVRPMFVRPMPAPFIRYPTY